jgi:hypothetical protein
MDPHAAGTEKLGVVISEMKGQNFLCEDSALFNLPLSYTAVVSSPEGLLVYRIST